MYSESVTQKQVEMVEERTGLKLVRHDPWQCDEMAQALDRKWQKITNPAVFKKPEFTDEERSFIMNERLMSKLDFDYWRRRWCVIELDGISGGGIGRSELWASQQLLLDKIAKLEEAQYEAFERGEPVDGILIADHKARQVGHTEFVRMLSLHRATLSGHARIIASTVDDKKKQELYRRDKLIYDNLPFFLRPRLEFDVKDDHIQTESTQSKINYFSGSSVSSMGQSQQFDLAHCTEVSEWLTPRVIEIDLLPALPQHYSTLCVLESRANGRQGVGRWWMEFTESVRRGRKIRWTYNFCPWYVEPKKYRRQPPAFWKPDEAAKLHAKKVYETSEEFCGKHVTLSAEQLYWWETTRAEYQENGSLNVFLTMYCATPEESFQHSGQSAFSTELLEELRNRASFAKIAFFEVKGAA